MGTKKKITYDLNDTFGDDFEVTYDEETPITYNLKESKATAKPKKKKGKVKSLNLDVVDVNTSRLSDKTVAMSDETIAMHYRNDSDYEDYEDDEDDYYDEDTNPHHHSDHYSKRRGVTPLAAPIRKSGKAVFKLAYALLRNLSLILILAIIGYMAVNFLRGSAPYGDILEEFKAQSVSFTLLAYFSVAACLILFELLSALWAMTTVRARDQYGPYREDVGRGRFSFIFIYLCSYGSFLLSSHIMKIVEKVTADATHLAIAEGVTGAVSVFGAMHNVLFGICAAGVVSCLLRKYHL